MKTKFRRYSKMALSFVLTLCMLFACVNVGTIDAGAWTVPDGWIIYFNGGSSKSLPNATETQIQLNSSYFSGDELTIFLKDNKNGSIQYASSDSSLGYGRERNESRFLTVIGIRSTVIM